jgi:endonuclease/exonuclease/phosphatase family metal-dependent hydrolase
MSASLRRTLAVAFLALLAVVLLRLWSDRRQGQPVDGPPEARAGGDFLFCSWNLENFFDDQDDHRTGADREYDAWFANDPSALREKLDHLSAALLKLNDGKGPDIFAGVEVESARAAELLCDALNKRLNDPALHYTHILMKEVSGGRHIAPMILTRLPVDANRTQLLGRRQRILEGHITANGHDLVVIASHWTSRLTDKEGNKRDDYADHIYGRCRAMVKSNPEVDLVVCGDFNDPPDAESVTKHLHATGDIESVRRGGDPPLLLDLLADKDPNRYGTHFYHKWFIFDHIVVAPGMLDERGWSCDPDSVQTINSLANPRDRQHRPWRFGNEHEKAERGYSDHFPVTVRLHVNEL